ncbi:MAG: Hpt protein [Pseudobdellovibrio sp.]|jgi:HPt (histidine-containing phosphotransfer) domain-containing protein|nr:Hpt protein [Pseudobdellovibrio sp.]
MQTNASYNIPEELKDIIPAYLERRKEDTVQLNDLMAKNDFEGIMRIAHKLKGNGASFGFDQITELGDKMNQAAKSENSEEVRKLIKDFESEVQQIRFNLDA